MKLTQLALDGKPLVRRLSWGTHLALFLGMNNVGQFSPHVKLIDTRLQSVLNYTLLEMEDDEEQWEEIPPTSHRQFLDLLESEQPGTVPEELKHVTMDPPPVEETPEGVAQVMESRVPPEPRRKRSQW